MCTCSEPGCSSRKQRRHAWTEVSHVLSLLHPSVGDQLIGGCTDPTVDGDDQRTKHTFDALRRAVGSKRTAWIFDQQGREHGALAVGDIAAIGDPLPGRPHDRRREQCDEDRQDERPAQPNSQHVQHPPGPVLDAFARRRHIHSPRRAYVTRSTTRSAGITPRWFIDATTSRWAAWLSADRFTGPSRERRRRCVDRSLSSWKRSSTSQASPILSIRSEAFEPIQTLANRDRHFPIDSPRWEPAR